jgi:hypothetical protein
MAGWNFAFVFPNGFIGPFDPRIMTGDHAVHPELNNFTSFHESNINFLAKV